MSFRVGIEKNSVLRRLRLIYVGSSSFLAPFIKPSLSRSPARHYEQIILDKSRPHVWFISPKWGGENP